MRYDPPLVIARRVRDGRELYRVEGPTGGGYCLSGRGWTFELEGYG